MYSAQDAPSLPAPVLGRWLTTLNEQIGDEDMTFASFNNEAKVYCGACHGENSSKQYRVNDEEYVEANAALIKDHITGTLNIMPPLPQNPLLPSNIQRWNTYLDKHITPPMQP